jgi:hypothetical protein
MKYPPDDSLMFETYCRRIKLIRNILLDGEGIIDKQYSLQHMMTQTKHLRSSASHYLETVEEKYDFNT